MSVVSKPTVLQASVFHFLTFRDQLSAREILSRWRNENSSDHRTLDEVHDCLVVTHRLDLADNCSVDVVLNSVEHSKLRRPGTQPLGHTAVLAVDIGDDESLVKELTGVDAEELAGGEVLAGIRLYQLKENELLLLYESQTALDVVMFLHGTLKLIEMFRHKVEGQFHQYAQSVRPSYLEAGKKLRSRLESFQLPAAALGHVSSSQVCDASDATVCASQRITDAYRDTLMHHGTVMQIEAMLSTNLRNMEFIRNHTALKISSNGQRMLHRRMESLNMHLGQVHADLGLTKPTLEAAKCVAELCHSQVLASLTATEARENRMRDEQDVRNEKNNRRFMLLGLWLAIIQVVVGWNSILPEASRVTLIPFLAWVLVPVIAFGLLDWLLSRQLRVGLQERSSFTWER